MSEPAHAPVRKAALIFILITVTLDILALGMIIPVLPHLFEQFLGNDTAMAARYYGYAGMLWAGMQFLWSPVLGTLSDRFGRRPVVLLSNLGLGLDYIFMALAPTLSWLFVGRAISGITAASITTAGAYIADVTPADKRAAAFGMIGAAFGIGFVIGPALGGLLGGIDPRLPFWVAAAMSLANFCYGWFVLPESLPPDKRTKSLDLARANPVGSLMLLRRYPQVFGLASVVLLSQFAHYVLPATFVLYADYRYHWGASAVGYVLALVGVCNAIVQAVLIGKVVPKLGERRTLLLGLAHDGRPWIDAGSRPAEPEHVRKVAEYLDAHAARPVRMIELTAITGMTLRAIQAAFRRHRGCSPSEFLHERRLLAARAAILAVPQQTISQVAVDHGFPHLGRFSVSYRARFGETPSETRARTR